MSLLETFGEAFQNARLSRKAVMNFRFVCRCRPKNDYVNHWNIQRRIYDFPLEETDQVATGLGTSLKNRFLVNGAIIDLGEVTSISVKLSLSGERSTLQIVSLTQLASRFLQLSVREAG